jgi:ParB/RepB/Spo0J family partition protein
MTPRRSQVPLVDQLPKLMKKRGLSTNRLAGMVGVSQSHLSRALRGADRKTIAGELAARIAAALELPEDWFPETRESRLFDRTIGHIQGGISVPSQPQASPLPITRERHLEWVATESIVPSDNNPRKGASFAEPNLASLRASIEQYGVLQPIIVQPYSRGMFKLIEGERRWRAANLDQIKELPAIVVARVSDHDEVEVMFHIHQERRPWEIIEEAKAIHRLLETNGHIAKHEMARRLNMSPTTLNERLILIDAGEKVMADIAAGMLEPKAVVHAVQVANLLERHRPDLVEQLGGRDTINNRLLDKARGRGKGVAEELKRLKNAIPDQEITDAALHAYVTTPELTVKDVERDVTSVPIKLATGRLRKRLSQVIGDTRELAADVMQVPDPNALQSDIAATISALNDLNARITTARPVAD